MTKHTPGPWKVHQYETSTGKVNTIIQGQGGNVCRMDIAGRVSDETLMQDATLIAELPSLMFALKNLLAAVDTDPIKSNFEGVVGAIAQAKYRIAKAQGDIKPDHEPF